MNAPSFTRRDLLRCAPAALFPTHALSGAKPNTRTFWVLKLLNPTVLRISAAGTARLHCVNGRGYSRIIEADLKLELRADDADAFHVAGLDGTPGAYRIEVPGVLSRSYFGSCQIHSIDSVLVAVATMDTETATGSIVGAELPIATAPLHATSAQAVATRSVLLSSIPPRHIYSDFCDTTHCQFLRSPLPPGSQAEAAVRQTSGFVLKQRGRIMPALYSAACGGQTEMGTDGPFEYISTRCDVCRQEGLSRRGHGWGLCQEGAMGLARLGWKWPEILSLFYSNATLEAPTRYLSGF